MLSGQLFVGGDLQFRIIQHNPWQTDITRQSTGQITAAISRLQCPLTEQPQQPAIAQTPERYLRSFAAKPLGRI
jgi:hypothetical protein